MQVVLKSPRLENHNKNLVSSLIITNSVPLTGVVGPVALPVPELGGTALLGGAFGRPGVLFGTDVSVGFTVAPIAAVSGVPT